LCRLDIELEPLQVFSTGLATRIVAVIRSGRVSGGLSGEVLPGGGDWMRLGTDRLGRLDVRCTLRLESGELVHMTAGGVADLSDGVPAAALASVRFEGGTLEGDVYVAELDITAEHVVYEVSRLASARPA
jgi:hypothetical protein